MPCAVQQAGSTITSVSYANASAPEACPGATWNITYSARYASDDSAPGPQQSLTLPAAGAPPATSVRSCASIATLGALAGGLPANVCAQISDQLAAATGAPNDISGATAVYILRLSGATGKGQLPTYAGIDYSLTLQLPAAIPEPLRMFEGFQQSRAPIKLQDVSNTPGLLKSKGYYNVPTSLGNGAAAGLLVAVMGAFGSNNAGTYYYAPSDLLRANAAFGLPAPPFANVTNSNLSASDDGFTANSATGCFTAFSGACGEAALDTQTVSQFGAGSGADYGFGASVSNAANLNYTNEQVGGRAASQGGGGSGVHPAGGMRELRISA